MGSYFNLCKLTACGADWRKIIYESKKPSVYDAVFRFDFGRVPKLISDIAIKNLSDIERYLT